MNKPAAPTSAFFWRGTPSVIGASMVPKPGDRSMEARLQREALAKLSGKPTKARKHPTAAARPPFVTVANAVGIKHGRQPKLYTTNGLVKPTSTSLQIEGREAGQASTDRRDALRRGGR